MVSILKWWKVGHLVRSVVVIYLSLNIARLQSLNNPSPPKSKNSPVRTWWNILFFHLLSPLCEVYPCSDISIFVPIAPSIQTVVLNIVPIFVDLAGGPVAFVLFVVPSYSSSPFCLLTIFPKLPQH
jgi:hypothetical protein